MRKNLALVLAVSCTGLFSATSAMAQDAIVVEEETVSLSEAADCKTQYYVDKHDNWFIQLGAGIDVPLVENRLVDGKARQIGRAHV